MRILITGDDGPPGSTSPYVLGLWQALTKKGHEVAVVLPSTQKSWGGMQFQAHRPVSVWYYYPRLSGVEDDSLWDQGTGNWSAEKRSVNTDEGELGEWVLLDASPASCANAGIYNHATLFPPTSGEQAKPFDLVLTGPNFGRNTGTAFALGSGTIGSALAGALTGTKAIALSFAHFKELPHDPPNIKQAHERLAPKPSDPADSTDSPTAPGNPQVQRKVVEAALDISIKVVEHLYENWEAEVRAYSVNVPMAWALMETKVVWTKMWIGQHARLYLDPIDQSSDQTSHGAGFSDLSAPKQQDHQDLPFSPENAPKPTRRLVFQPDMQGMLAPPVLQEGTDVWALMHGWVSVSRLETAFREPTETDVGEEVEVKL